MRNVLGNTLGIQPLERKEAGSSRGRLVCDVVAAEASENPGPTLKKKKKKSLILT